eukprot:220764-Hanusia_phi.AAC.1
MSVRQWGQRDQVDLTGSLQAAQLIQHPGRGAEGTSPERGEEVTLNVLGSGISVDGRAKLP